MEYICRKLKPEDIGMVMEMNRNYREFICYENVRIFLANPMNWLFAAIHHGMIIGFAYGYELNRLNNAGNMLYIHEVGVMAAYQRQGIGYTLMSELKAACNKRNICKYFLSAYQSNAGANALYQKLGGVVSEESGGSDIMYYFPTK